MSRHLAIVLIVGTFLSGSLSCRKDGDNATPPAASNGQKAIAVCIGVEVVSPKGYPILPPRLPSAVNDAKAMRDYLGQQGFSTKLLIATDSAKTATTTNVLKEIEKASRELSDGGFFVITFAGHGYEVPDKNGDEKIVTPGDISDETWALWDHELLDDKIYEALGKFKPNVRVLLISDSCSSGTVIRLASIFDVLDFVSEMRLGDIAALHPTTEPRDMEERRPGMRTLTLREGMAAYNANKALYDQQASTPTVEVQNEWMLSITACLDSETADSNATNGLFTASLLEALKNRGNTSTFESLYPSIREATQKARKERYPTETQTPQLFPRDVSRNSLAKQSPFDLTAGTP